MSDKNGDIDLPSTERDDNGESRVVHDDETPNEAEGKLSQIPNGSEHGTVRKHPETISNDDRSSNDDESKKDDHNKLPATKKQRTSPSQNTNTKTNTHLTHAYGKLILFGEHFVVYKAPALVGAVSAYTDCSLSFLPPGTTGLEVTDDRPAVPHYKTTKKNEATAAIDLVLKHLALDPSERGIRLRFGGDLCCASGIGASAAQVVSLARAINLATGGKMTEDEVNAAGYEGEKGYHGTPSGIDNTAATFGGVLRFRRTDGDPVFVRKVLKEPVRIVYASTGITASTTEVVGDVRRRKEADEGWFAGLLARYVDLARRGEEALDEGDLALVGKLLDENHGLCQELTVSCKELDELVLAARGAGAVGAKMSGTGRGGLMLALTPTEECQERVAKALEQIAPQVWKTTFA